MKGSYFVVTCPLLFSVNRAVEFYFVPRICLQCPPPPLRLYLGPVDHYCQRMLKPVEPTVLPVLWVLVVVLHLV